MKTLLRIFPLWGVITLLPGSWGLRGPREVRGLVGGSLSLQCQYENDYETHNKYWCQGDTWILCHILIQTESNRHITQGRISIRDNVAALTFTVTMEELTQGDSGKYWCGIDDSLFDPGDPVAVTVLPAGSWGLKGPGEVRGLDEGSLSLECQYERGYDINRKYWCRGDEWSSCDILAETESEAKDIISITENFTAHTFTVTMEQLTEADSGKYWCGIEGLRWNYGDPVTVTVLPGSWGLHGPREVRGLVGGSLSLQCQYENDYETHNKYWCQGDIRVSCRILIQTESNRHMTQGRISIRDNVTALTFTVTVEQLTEADSGKYWCGIDDSLLDPGAPVVMTVLPAGSWGPRSPREVKGLVGGSLSLQCQYERGYDINRKYWCRGEEWSSCHFLAETESEAKDRISIMENITAHTFTVTMEQLTQADSGKYWCGTEGLRWNYGDPVIVTVLPDPQLSMRGLIAV
ncbi:polymeric immunoglobulin receptor-like isoform X2 [Rhinatrema bivittatum]|uniref:polymeric immunoglobulin receptor-like isoform X2 n=1 Tax=Rhinatrema bivittatum TaxID=194408 RepID=UPI001127AFF3|nr:polymeric immunoglobulin receptor-like isoform X2 [Rhinatrema bivittatum]